MRNFPRNKNSQFLKKIVSRMLYHRRNSNKRFFRIRTQRNGFRANSLQSRNPTSTDRSRRPFETLNQREIKSTMPVSSAGSYSYDGQCATMRGPLEETMRKEREGREKKEDEKTNDPWRCKGGPHKWHQVLRCWWNHRSYDSLPSIKSLESTRMRLHLVKILRRCRIEISRNVLLSRERERDRVWNTGPPCNEARTCPMLMAHKSKQT